MSEARVSISWIEWWSKTSSGMSRAWKYLDDVQYAPLLHSLVWIAHSTNARQG